MLRFSFEMSMSEPARITRTIEWYARGPNDALVGERVLEGIALADLQRLWSRPADDPMVDVYRIEPRHRAFVEAHAGIVLDFANFEYVLGCYSTDDSAT